MDSRLSKQHTIAHDEPDTDERTDANRLRAPGPCHGDMNAHMGRIARNAGSRHASELHAMPRRRTRRELITAAQI
jgi:hypothetical protein